MSPFLFTGTAYDYFSYQFSPPNLSPFANITTIKTHFLFFRPRTAHAQVVSLMSAVVSPQIGKPFLKILYRGLFSFVK